jgi:hypothetical protein
MNNGTEEAGSKAAKKQKSTTELSFIENNGSTAHQLLAHSRNEGEFGSCDQSDLVSHECA